MVGEPEIRRLMAATTLLAVPPARIARADFSDLRLPPAGSVARPPTPQRPLARTNATAGYAPYPTVPMGSGSAPTGW